MKELLVSLGCLGLGCGAAGLAWGQNLSIISNDQKKVMLSGYGDMQASYLDYGQDRNLSHGAQQDSRVIFDATRFTAKIEGFFLPHDIEFEAEVEFEHGGTGTAMDIEYEESGEYEHEIAKGGEVQLEEFYLKKLLNEHYSLAAGRILVGVGLLSAYSLPTDYLGVQRSETESVLLPGVWTEMGLGLDGDYEDFQFKLQVVNGLDSSGFSSHGWVATGHQGKFEQVSATDPAAVVRLDLKYFPGYVLGVSAYYGDTSANRPIAADMRRDCNRQAPNEAAPCGYVKAPVTIADVHVVAHLEKLRGSAAGIWGRLENASLVTQRNGILNKPSLGVVGTPVGSEALGAWSEIGYDVGAAVGTARGAQLTPFARYEYYDTMHKTAPGIVKNPRFERRVVSLGLSYVVDGALFAKLDFGRRSYGSADFRPENAVNIGAGFIY